MPNLLVAGNSTNGGTAITTDTSGTLNIVTGSGSGSTAITADGSQNVGIGTATPATKLNVSQSNTSVGVLFNGTTRAVRFGFDTTGSIIEGVDNTGVTSFQPLSVGGSDVRFTTSGTEQARITSAGLFQFNSGYGSVATSYGCRAWVNFNGTGTVAIRSSGNVTSITDVGVGYYRINFTNSMPDVNYSIVGAASDDGVTATFVCTSGTWGSTSQTTTSALVFVGATGVAYDRTYVGISVFR